MRRASGVMPTEVPRPKPQVAAKDELPVDTNVPKDEVVVDGDEEDDALPPEAQPKFERNEVATEGAAKFRADAVHVYGLDFLRTEHMNEIFSQFDHKFIEWINDSSANIIFRDRDSAKKALESLTYPKKNDKPWRRTPDILVNDDCPPVYLQMRLAATTDIKKSKRAVPKVSAQDAKAKRPSQRGALGQIYRDGLSTELLEQAGLLGKRKRIVEPPTAEELERRDKRRAKFGEATPAAESEPAKDVLGDDLSKPKLAGEAAVKQYAIEATAEEIARREKRATRFKDEDLVDKAATTATETSESAVVTTLGATKT